jgi:hypothetical protein
MLQHCACMPAPACSAVCSRMQRLRIITQQNNRHTDAASCDLYDSKVSTSWR